MFNEKLQKSLNAGDSASRPQPNLTLKNPGFATDLRTDAEVVVNRLQRCVGLPA